ncbi:Oidioi.mRNA.OKI2018_I69.XSR.g15218.t1.cds [Oikopleura dioica]|uniref:Oidioi.mRNA.OKI2018_I69.XSR.g15218.t1.cds n=1 Tax=Oikopleura dioica TaxID=34765 RepID=A0ABN7SC51_OIKDI|nr:Oidioi.mRNA.OKI2018_I69.XSR.g15218.t1.cds [Oikopleura dioica]
MDDEKQENQKANSRRSNPSTIRLTAEDIQYLCEPEYYDWMVATGRIPELQSSKSEDGIENSRTGSSPDSGSDHLVQEKPQKRRRSTAVVENIRDVFRQGSGWQIY